MTKNDTQSKPVVGLVLISGAGLGSWVWNDVNMALKTPTLVISFPESKSKQSMSLDDYANDALEQIKEWHKVDNYVIVGHSIGAIIAIRLTQLLRDQVVGLVAIGAVVPKNGGSFFSALPFPQNLILPLVTRLAGTRPPSGALKKAYCNDLSDTQAEEVVRCSEPESYALYSDKLLATPLDIPCLYVKLLKDQNLNPSLQDSMAVHLNADITTLDTGHVPMLGKPTELAQVLDGFIISRI